MPDFLVIQLARMGDLIQSKRLVLTLAREGSVHLALDASLAELAAKLYPFANIHPLSAHAGGVTPGDVLHNNSNAFKTLAGAGFDAVYNLNRSPLALAVAALFQPEKVHGYRLDSGQALSSRWTALAARWTAERRSSPMNLADFWAWFHPEPIEPSKVNPIARPKNNPLSGSAQRVGVVMSGRVARRSLPPEYLARVLESVFQARKGPEFVLLGGADERASAERLKGFLPRAALQRVMDYTGKTGLADLPALVESLDLLITPDTGLMHLAAHLGVPVTAFFLSSAWAWETGPYGLGHTVWQSTLPCSPCLESAKCPNKTACLAPFADQHWLGHLAGTPGNAWPDHMTGLISTLDDLGVTYLTVDGDDDVLQNDIRLDKRAMLARYLGMGGGVNAAGDAGAALLREKDWMLPEY